MQLSAEPNFLFIMDTLTGQIIKSRLNIEERREHVHEYHDILFLPIL